MLWHSRILGGFRSSTIRLASCLFNQFLRLLGIFASVGAEGLSCLASMLSCETSNLGGLLVDHVASVVQMCVNELLVLQVHERGQEGGAGGQECESPKRKPLD